MANNKKDFEYPLPIGFVLKGGLMDYRIEEVLGQGGFGITYRVSAKVTVGHIKSTMMFAIKEHFVKGRCHRAANKVTVEYSEEAAAEVEKMGGLPDPQRVTPILLIATYLILTAAELFISPLGISFVSKVAPPQYQGIMQGGWLAATGIGNQLLFIGALLYENVPLWLTWSVFVIVCLISMTVMFSMLHWLNRIAR